MKLKHIFAYSLYNTLMCLIALGDLSKWLLYLIRRACIRKANPATKMEFFWGQKHGILPFKLPPKQSNKRVLVHCASMGEVVAAMPLIKTLAQSTPDLQFVVSTNTLTGKQQVLKSIPPELKGRIYHNYLPLDLPWLMGRLLNKVTPCLVLIMEVELWPNLIRQCQKRSVPVSIVNARLTNKTYQSYQKLNWLSEPMIASLHSVYCRNRLDYDNYQALGLPSEKLSLLGNIKFDIKLPNLDSNDYAQQLGLTNRTVLIAGSTHEGEEAAIVSAYQKLKPHYPNLVLIIVPRHPHRFESVYEYLIQQQLSVARMSNKQVANKQTDVLYGDMMGQLSRLYSVADIAFVGGSLVKKGGHNPIEASVFGVPVLMGQHIYNNPEIVETIADNGGLKICNTQAELDSQLEQWLQDPTLRHQAGQCGLETIKANQGILVKLVDKLMNIIN